MKNKRALILLFAANTVSGASQGITIIAVPWYIASILGLKGLFLQLYMGINVVSLVWGLYAGALIDRYDRKHIFIAASIVGCMTVLAMAAIGYAQGGVPLWGAALAFAITIFNFNIHYPNLYAFGQEITSPEHYGRITSWLEIQGQLTSAFAGGLAAILLEGLDWQTLLGRIHIRAWELQKVFLLDGCTYLVAIALLLFMRYERVAQRKIDRGSIWSRIQTGLHWLRAHPMVFVFGAASYAVFVTILVTAFGIQPIYVEQHLQRGAAVFAASDMFYAAGSLLAGLSIVRIFGANSPVRAVILLALLGSAYFLIGMRNTDLGIFFASFLLLGTSNAGIRILRMTWMFNHVPNDVLGRTGSVFNSMNVLCRIAFLGLFSIPFFTGKGVTWAFGIQALFILLAVAVLGLFYGRISRASFSNSS